MQRLVHIDMKGGTPTPEFLVRCMPFLRDWGATGVLIEWEDMLPYTGKLAVLQHQNAYNKEQVQQVLDAAAAVKLIVVPLVQAIGDME